VATESKENGIEYELTWLRYLVGRSREMLPLQIQILIQNMVVIYLTTRLVCCRS